MPCDTPGAHSLTPIKAEREEFFTEVVWAPGEPGSEVQNVYKVQLRVIHRLLSGPVSEAALRLPEEAVGRREERAESFPL